MHTNQQYAMGWKASVSEQGKIPTTYLPSRTAVAVRPAQSIITSIVLVLGVVFLFSTVLAHVENRLRLSDFAHPIVGEQETHNDYARVP